MNQSVFLQTALNLVTETGMKILGAIALWIIGHWLAKLAVKYLSRAMVKSGVDSTLIGSSSC